MISSEPQELNYFPPNFSLIQTNSPQFNYFTKFSNTMQNYQNTPPETYPQNSSNSTSDEDHFSIIDERKQRRMISNRESARRSRMRKQRHLDELWSQVVRLRTENQRLVDKLSDVSETHNRIVLENERLKEEASELRQTVMDIHINTIFRDLEDISCNTAHLRAESSNPSVNTSTNLLH